MSLPIMACESTDTTRGERDFDNLLQPAATTAVSVESVQERSVCAMEMWSQYSQFLFLVDVKRKDRIDISSRRT